MANELVFELGRKYNSKSYPDWIGVCVFVGTEIAVLRSEVETFGIYREWAPRFDSNHVWQEYRG